MKPRAQNVGCSLPFLLIVALVIGVATWLLLRPRGETIFERESEFGRIRVTESADGLRALYTGAGRGRQTALYPDRPTQLVSAYTQVGMIGLALVPADARILFVGLGGGAMPTFTRNVMPTASIDVVEIDPAIVDVAQRFFGFRPEERMRMHTDDGRAFIERAAPGSWDLIVLDAFSDDEIPRALATRQFLDAVSRALTPGGVVVSNLWTANADYASMVTTYDTVFGRIHRIAVPRHRQVILVAGPAVDTASVATFERAAADLLRRADLGFDLHGLVRRGYQHDAHPAGRVLEDDTPAS